jgi:hypothetical protein
LPVEVVVFIWIRAEIEILKEGNYKQLNGNRDMPKERARLQKKGAFEIPRFLPNLIWLSSKLATHEVVLELWPC